MSRAALLSLLTSAGCVMFSRPGEPPTDRKMFLVRDAIDEVAVKSFEKHVRGDGWTMRSCVVGSGTNGGAHEWRSRFACLPAGEDYYTSQKLFALREADFSKVLVPIQWDVLEAVRRTNVSFTSSHMTGVETHPGVRSARFEFGYLRHGGKVAGSVVGTLTPCDRDPLWVDLVVSVKEWTTGWSPDVQDGRVPP